MSARVPRKTHPARPAGRLRGAVEAKGAAGQGSEPAESVIIAGWVTVDPNKREASLASFAALVRRARSTAGCLDAAFTANPVDPSRVQIFEHWQSEEHLRAWRASCRAPKRVTPLLPTEVRKHRVAWSGPPF